jgi:hypothetical protein
MKVKQKRNFTNPGKAETYLAAKTGLGHSKSTGNPDVKVFQGLDARISPDTPTSSGTRHSQPPRAQGASPLRVRFTEPRVITAHGTSRLANVTNATEE